MMTFTYYIEPGKLPKELTQGNPYSLQVGLQWEVDYLGGILITKRQFILNGYHGLGYTVKTEDLDSQILRAMEEANGSRWVRPIA